MRSALAHACGQESCAAQPSVADQRDACAATDGSACSMRRSVLAASLSPCCATNSKQLKKCSGEISADGCCRKTRPLTQENSSVERRCAPVLKLLEERGSRGHHLIHHGGEQTIDDARLAIIVAHPLGRHPRARHRSRYELRRRPAAPPNSTGCHRGQRDNAGNNARRPGSPSPPARDRAAMQERNRRDLVQSRTRENPLSNASQQETL